MTMTVGYVLYTCITPYKKPTIVNMFQVSQSGCVINYQEYLIRELMSQSCNGNH